LGALSQILKDYHSFYTDRFFILTAFKKKLT
jgi:hypothetical protein